VQTQNWLRRIRPFLELLVRATLLFPFGLAVMVLWLAAFCALGFLPVYAAATLYAGDTGHGMRSLLGGIAAFFAWRLLTRKFWQTPDSLL
jgi:hypothetical protein